MLDPRRILVPVFACTLVCACVENPAGPRLGTRKDTPRLDGEHMLGSGAIVGTQDVASGDNGGSLGGGGRSAASTTATAAEARAPAHDGAPAMSGGMGSGH